MADNTVLPGTGDVIAADEIAGVKYQRVKLTHGVDGVAVDASATDPIPVVDQTAEALQALNDTMLYMLSAILEKMPRVTSNDQASVSIEIMPTVAFTANQDIRNIGGALNNISNIGGKTTAVIPDALSQMGALHLYQNIIVS